MRMSRASWLAVIAMRADLARVAPTQRQALTLIQSNHVTA